MFAFLFVTFALVLPLVVALDVVWWAAGLRLMKRPLWRVLLCVFMAVQTAGLVSILARRFLDFDMLRHVPKGVVAAVFIWHFFGLVILAPIGAALVCAWIIRAAGRRLGLGAGRPHAAADAKAVSRRHFMGAAAALAPPLLTMGLTGVALSQLNRFRVRRFTLELPALPQALDGMTIAHVTDIHVGRITCGQVLEDMVRTTNELKADLVLLTGDLIDYDLADLDEGIRLVKAMKARCGLWMVEGNHDLFEDPAEFERRVKAAGIGLLLNESAEARVNGVAVQLLGTRWAGGDYHARDTVTAGWVRELAKLRRPEAFPILLSHHPHAFDAAQEAGLPLALAGHTHGGQLMFDSNFGVGPMMFRYWSGLYERGTGKLVVSNGVGNWFPVRINAPAEIVHLTLRSAAARP